VCQQGANTKRLEDEPLGAPTQKGTGGVGTWPTQVGNGGEDGWQV
jgi:hypothetical protein